MKILNWDDLLTRKTKLEEPIALTIGVFDGVHSGHRNLIAKIVRNLYYALPVVCTFTLNPAQVLNTNYVKGSILSFRQKMLKLKALGLDCVILIDFSLEFSKLTGKQFIQQLRNCLEIKKLAVGYNFHFGRGRYTGAVELERMLEGSETELEIIPPTSYLDKVVSSSRIREAIIQGRFNEARTMLTEDYYLDLYSGTKAFRERDWVSITRNSLTQVLPQAGRYRVSFRTETGEFAGEVSITDDVIGWKHSDQRTVREIRFIELEDD